MPLSPEEKKDLDTACMRHRLYLLAKYNHNAFVRQVGADKADAAFDDLKKNSRKDAKICNLAREGGMICDDIVDLIFKDVNTYGKSTGITKTLTPMKCHLVWVLCSHLVLLAVAACLCMKPWMNGTSPEWGSQDEIIQIGIVSIITFLLFVWAAKKVLLAWEMRNNPYFRFFICNGKALLKFFGAPILFLVAACALAQTTVSQSSVFIGLSLSIVVFAHALLILDCIAGLSPRGYYFGPQCFINWILGWFKGNFRLGSAFGASLNNSYVDGFRKYEDWYHDAELDALENLMRNKIYLLSNKHGTLEFHPSTSYQFIVAYILVDIIHTSCIIAWMVSLNSYLEGAGVGPALVAAVISCGLVYVLLGHPLYSTNDFHRCICKNLFAYRVSHLFRKLFYSAILVGGIAALSYLN